MNKWIKTSSEDWYRHSFTRLPHVIQRQYTKKNWGQIPTLNPILIYSYLMQDTSNNGKTQSSRSAVSTRIHCTSAFRTGCSDLSTFIGFCEVFVHYTNCMKIEIVMQLLKNLYYQISPTSVDWKHTEGWVHTIPLCLFWFSTSRKQRTVTARRWNEGHIQQITAEVKESTKAYGN
jgi:hypothetical protein